MNKPKGIEKRENGAESPEAERKPKKRPRVSQRKELAVVTIGMVAAIISFGSLLAGHQAQADQTSNATPAAQVSSTTPGSSSSSGQYSNEQASAAQTPAAQAPSAAPS